MALASIGFLALFVALLVVAVTVAPDFDPWRGYWCELLHDESGSTLWMRSAFLAMAACLFCFWRSAPRLVTARVRPWIETMGVLSALSIPLLTVLRYEDGHWTHVLVLFMSAGLGAAALALMVVGTLSSRLTGVIQRALGVALLVLAAANLVLYADLTIRGGESATLPLIQKAGTVVLVAWLAATALAARRVD